MGCTVGKPFAWKPLVMCKMDAINCSRRAILGSFLFAVLLAITPLSAFADGSVTLAWSACADPCVVGYNIYYGGASGAYTNAISAGNSTNATVSGLVQGATYYFAATSLTSSGFESPFSSEVAYLIPPNAPPVNQPPTLNAITNLSINENAGLQTVSLSGITAGDTNGNQTLSVTAVSSNTGLIPNPTVYYSNANTTGLLTFTPVSNNFGTANITVTVNDGMTRNNFVTRSFTVTVLAYNDQTRPAVQITTPISNQQTTNGTITMTGKASDNLAIGAVYYALNGSGWTTATTGNVWTNWTASLALTPGTNTVQVYAADTSGNISSTNTIQVVYLVLKPMTVQIAGRGSVSPNCNGTLLAINENYSITAKASSGFAFTNWTGGVTSTNATLRFMMQPNLTVTANFADVQRPTVSIVTPTSSQKLTNGTVTVTGKAGDNVAVSAVYYALNGSGWTMATTTNGWTNWMAANLTLTPGTNTLQAYAVDTTGNAMSTYTVRFVYLVYKPMTVQIAGRGSVSPDYNGTLLAINLNYLMTAKATPGFAFTNWTGSLTSTNATLRFMMQPNLTVTAHFVDIQKPTISIVTPTSSQKLTNGTVTVTGKAGDNLAVGAVYYALNGSGWTTATTGNGWTNWTASLTLFPGTNTVQAYAVDNSGNISSTNTTRFVYLVLKPMTVQIAGRGSVSPNYNGALLAINENYTMTAKAASGFAFTNWIGGAPSTNATLRFTMQTNLTVTAHFVDIQKPTISIVTPTSNQKLTNGTVTVIGKAGDNVAVGAVYYALNGLGWTTATTGNGWTNWTASLTLPPGTNTLQAYAVDTSGNASPVSSCKVIFLTTLTGSVSLNTTNSPPPSVPSILNSVAYANHSYSFTVSGATGYKYAVEVSTDLVNWTPVETNTAPFTFVDNNAGQYSQRFYRSVYAP